MKLIRNSLTTLFTLVAMSSHIGAIAESSGPSEQEIKERIKEYGPGGSYYSSTETKVKSGIEDWADGVVGDFTFGNQDAAGAHKADIKYLQKTQTEACNNSDGGYTHKHTYKDLHNGYEVEEDVDNCEVYFKYKGKGKVAGTCRINVMLGKYCQPLHLKYDLVDYMFPTHQITLSDQAFHSRYLEQDAVKEAIKSQIDYLKGDGQKKDTPETLKQVFGSKAWTDLGGKAGTYTAQEVPILDTPEAIWSKSGLGKRVYSRHFGYKQIIADDKWYIPHIHKKESPWITEIDDFELSNWLQYSEDVNSKIYSSHLETPQICLAANVQSGKSPVHALVNPLWKAAGVSQDENIIASWICIDKVGEVGPYASQFRRQMISDGIWQGFVRGMQIYYKRVKPEKRQSDFYPVNMDRVSIIPSQTTPEMLNEKLNEEVSGPKKCDPLEDLIKENREYKTVNVREPGQAAEVSFDLFHRFSGCWGLKGELNTIPEIERTEPSRFKEDEVRYE